MAESAGKAELAAAAARAAAEAAVMLAAADPAVVGRPLPVVEVTAGNANDSSAPLRAGGPFRVRLTPDVLRASREQRRFAVAHELAHICRGEVTHLVEVTPPLVAAAVIPVAVLLASVVVLRFHISGWRAGVFLLAVLVVGVLVMLVALTRLARRSRAAEAATDQLAATVFGAAVTKFDMTRWAGSTGESRSRWRTHPYAAERYAATNAALQAGNGQRAESVDNGRI